MDAIPNAVDRPGFRVEELAARSGMPVRTIREYQTWRVLHPPVKRGRVGWYDESHLDRLRTIARLQERGYSIAGIRDLLDAWATGSELRDVLGGVQPQPDTLDETPLVVSRRALGQLLPQGDDDVDGFTASLVDAGVVAPLGDDVVARSPALLVIVSDALRAGLPRDEAIGMARSVVAATAGVADEVAAAVTNAISRGRVAEVEPMLRRGRVLLGQALASHVIDQVGRRLLASAEDDPAVREVIAHLRIGSFAVASEGPGSGGMNAHE
jgi:DNA-binding transcriptional MerR regulator